MSSVRALLRQRVVAPEWLDTLAPGDPRAIRSRADLRRINRLTRAVPLLARSLDALLSGASVAPLVELGAGDGTVALRLAQQLSARWPGVSLTLLDLHPDVSDATLAGFHALGWNVQVVQADVLEWLDRVPPTAPDALRPIVFANLFVHHFEGARLQALLAGVADRAQGFVCLEPRRCAAAWFGSRLLGAIGCNDVTRHDASISVRAGFTAEELSPCWPDASGWALREKAAGLFSHRFAAARRQA